MVQDLDYDIEKSGAVSEKRSYDVELVDNVGAVSGETFEIGDSLYAKTMRFAGRLNIEQRGIERVPVDERTDSSLVKIGTMVKLSQTLMLLESLAGLGCGIPDRL